MGQLSVKLNVYNIGGDIDGVLVNHLCHTDVICLISLSSAGMQQVLNVCDTCTYAKEYDLLYNNSKSYFLCFKFKCSILSYIYTESFKYAKSKNILIIVISEIAVSPGMKRQMCKLL